MLRIQDKYDSGLRAQMRTIIIGDSVFAPFKQMGNGKFPWEDIHYTATAVSSLLTSQGLPMYRLHEPVVVNLTKSTIAYAGGKKKALDFFNQVLLILEDSSITLPEFVELEVYDGSR